MNTILFLIAMAIGAGLATAAIVLIDRPRQGDEIIRNDPACTIDSSELIQILKMGGDQCQRK